MRILYIIYGEKFEYHIQAYFSILSLLSKKNNEISIWVLTDKPQNYKSLNYVNTISVTPDEISEWINVTGYSFRAKLKGLQKFVETVGDNQPFLFVDTDTMICGDITQILSMLNERNGVMYEKEGHPSERHGKPLKMWNSIKGKTINNITFGMEHIIWNSCVVGIPSGCQLKILELAITLCDFIYQVYPKCHFIEQYALGIAMQNYLPIKEAKKYILHYWANKPDWNKYITNKLLTYKLAGYGDKEMIEDVAKTPIDVLPISIHRSSTKRRINKLLDRVFPDKDIHFFNK